MNLKHEYPNLFISSKLTANATLGLPKLGEKLPPLEEQTDHTLYIEYVPTNRRDGIFGLFIEKWDRLEGLLGNAFFSLVGESLAVAETIFASFNGVKQISDVISALSENSLSADAHKKLDGLLDRVRKFASKRNKIIHGHWQMHVTMETIPGPNGIVFRQTHGEWRRIYKPIRSLERQNMLTNNEDPAAAKNIFTIDRLVEEIGFLDLLLADLQAFYEVHFHDSSVETAKKAHK